jgi:hypothetical protein
VRRRRYKSPFDVQGHPYAASHGQTVIPKRTMTEALRAAVAEARHWGAVVHVTHQTHARGRKLEVVAVCMPRFKHVDDLRKRPHKVIDCKLKKKPRKRRSRR